VRLIVSWLVLLSAVPLSGCVLDEVWHCDFDMRTATWVQENIPTETGVIAKSFRYGDFDGTLNKDAEHPS
jgi:hypothetical protein